MLKIRARMGVDPGEDRHIAVLNRELSQDVLDGRGTCVCRSIFGGRSFYEQKEWAYRARLTDVHVESKHVGLRRWTSWWPRQEGWLDGKPSAYHVAKVAKVSNDVARVGPQIRRLGTAPRGCLRWRCQCAWSSNDWYTT